MHIPVAVKPGVDDPSEGIRLRPLHCRLPPVARRNRKDIILLTLSREMLKCRAASRRLMPSEQASRTFRYMSTVMILPPSLQPAEKT